MLAAENIARLSIGLVMDNALSTGTGITQSPTSDPVLTDIYNYQPVNDRLATAGQPTEAQLVAIAQAGFEVVINLALHTDPRYSLPDEPGLVRSLGLEYVHIPVQFDNPQESDLLAFFAAMDRHSQQKRWVHCAANKRVSAFVGLYQTIQQQQPPEQAFQLMRQIWQPNPVWAGFIAAMLAKYQ